MGAFSISWGTSGDPASRPCKCGLGSKCHAWPGRVSHSSSKAQLAGYLKGLAGGLLEWDAGIQ